jgi:hypothetical protein
MADTARVLRDLREAAMELEQRATHMERTTEERETDLKRAERIRQIVAALESLDVDE